MSNIIPFSDTKLPAFLANRKGGNADLTANVGAGFPVMSIKGKNWAIVRGDERKVITRKDEDGDEVPARTIEVVLLRANKNLSKNFYAKEFEEGTNAEPDCSSANGLTPDSHIEKPVAKSCATCPKNVWGTGKGGKGKACQDHRRMAVAPAGQINDPMLLRVPPASLKPLAEYAKMLDKRGVDYDAVVTKLKFDVDSSTPLLVFEPRGFVDEETYAKIQETKASELVEQIIGTAESARPAAPAKSDDDEEFEQAPAKAKKSDVSDEELDEAVKPAKAAKSDDEEAPAKPEKKAKKSDDEEEAPAKPKGKGKVTESLEEDLDSLLAELDD